MAIFERLESSAPHAHATNATHATHATYATHAIHATHATHATHAASAASSANAVMGHDGHRLADSANGGRPHTPAAAADGWLRAVDPPLTLVWHSEVRDPASSAPTHQ